MKVETGNKQEESEYSSFSCNQAVVLGGTWSSHLDCSRHPWEKRMMELNLKAMDLRVKWLMGQRLASLPACQLASAKDSNIMFLRCCSR